MEGRDLQHEKGVIADLLPGWIRNCLKLGELGSRGKEERIDLVFTDLWT